MFNGLKKQPVAVARDATEFLHEVRRVLAPHNGNSRSFVNERKSGVGIIIRDHSPQRSLHGGNEQEGSYFDLSRNHSGYCFTQVECWLSCWVLRKFY